MRVLKHPITGKDMPEFLTGVITPMLTALNEDLSLDEEGNRSLIQWYRKTGAVTTVFVRSGVGQMFHFSFDQAKTIIDLAIEEARDDMYVLAGTSGTFPSGNATQRPREKDYVEETVELSRYATRQGATGVVVLPLGLEPASNLPDKIFDFYERLNASIDVPIVLYEPPGTPAPYSMTPSLLHRLADLPRVKGMKLSTPDMLRFGLLCDATKDQDFTMISGHEGAFFPSLVLGAGGVIGGGCNTHPELIREVFDAFMAGDWERARRAQFEVSKLLGVRTIISDPYSEVPVNAAKLYLARKGVRIKPFQWPNTRFDERRMDEIEKAIDRAVGLLRRP